MVVLQVIARLNLGGTAKYLISLNNGFNKIGMKSLIATGFVEGSEIEDPEVKKLKPIRINHLGRKISLINDLRAASELRKVILQVQPDVIHTHTFKAGLLVRAQRNKIEEQVLDIGGNESDGSIGAESYDSPPEIEYEEEEEEEEEEMNSHWDGRRYRNEL